MEKNLLVTSQDGDCVLGKHELRPLYETLIVPHLNQIGQPVQGFDAWFEQLDSWGRGITYASQLKEYLIGFNYANWGEISYLFPGLKMESITESGKISLVTNQQPWGGPITPETKAAENYS